jgi:CHAT domain-containing protein
MLTEESGDDGLVTADRVLKELRLTPGAFVNLAGCSSAFHEESVGPSAGGLVPAFLVAGAGAVLATLWDLDDLAASAFSEAFYGHLLAGRGPTAALARVQRACVMGELGRTLQSPEIWATYVLYSSGR